MQSFRLLCARAIDAHFLWMTHKSQFQCSRLAHHNRAVYATISHCLIWLGYHLTSGGIERIHNTVGASVIYSFDASWYQMKSQTNQVIAFLSSFKCRVWMLCSNVQNVRCCSRRTVLVVFLLSSLPTKNIYSLLSLYLKTQIFFAQLFVIKDSYIELKTNKNKTTRSQK